MTDITYRGSYTTYGQMEYDDLIASAWKDVNRVFPDNYKDLTDVEITPITVTTYPCSEVVGYEISYEFTIN